MKRWKTKNEKMLIGGLFLLLVLSSLPWVDRNQLFNGFSALSSEQVTTGEAVKLSNEKGIGVVTPPSANGEVAVTSKSAPNLAPKPEVSHKVGMSLSHEKHLKEMNQAAESCDPDKVICEKSFVNETTKTIDGAITPETKKVETKNPEPKTIVKVIYKKEKKSKDKDDEDDYDSLDEVEKVCLSKKSGSGKEHQREKESESYTKCAMNKLMSLAKKLPKNSRPTGDEMKNLIEENVYHNLLNQIKEGLSEGASRDDQKLMDKAHSQIESLIEKLTDSHYADARKKLSEIKRIAMNEQIKTTHKLLNDANRLASTGDFVGASMLLNEFQQSRIQMTSLLNTDLHRMRDVYNQMRGEDGFPLRVASSEFRELYYQPYNTVNTRLWNSNSVGDYGNYQGSRLSRSGGFGSAYQPGSGYRGGPQGGYYGRDNFNNGRQYNNGNRPPVPGQSGQWDTAGNFIRSGGPMVNGQQGPPFNQTAYNGAYGPNTLQGSNRPYAPNIYGSANYGPNYGINGRAQQPFINGGAWRPATPGISNPTGFGYGNGYGTPNYYGPTYGNNNFYSGYSTAPYSAGWGPGMQQGIYGQQQGITRPRF